MKVLILCTGNSCRSQMAHGFLQSFDHTIEVYSGGTEPAAQVNAKTVEMMKEVGIDISSHVFLSSSYVFNFFKNETGQTLNQYLTEFRMEKAKLLLRDARYKISDISSRVGYSDGNYFGKSFKKYSGLSPSEYREKNMQ